MATVAKRQRAKATPRSRWKTIHFPPDKEYQRLTDKGFRCVREKKLDHAGYNILATFLNHGLNTGVLYDPDAKDGFNREKAIDVDVDELCKDAHKHASFSYESLTKHVDLFVELGFFKGLELRGDE
jgi:hypothetical protein